MPNVATPFCRRLQSKSRPFWVFTFWNVLQASHLEWFYKKTVYQLEQKSMLSLYCIELNMVKEFALFIITCNIASNFFGIRIVLKYDRMLKVALWNTITVLNNKMTIIFDQRLRKHAKLKCWFLHWQCYGQDILHLKGLFRYRKSIGFWHPLPISQYQSQ